MIRILALSVLTALCACGVDGPPERPEARQSAIEAQQVQPAFPERAGTPLNRRPFGPNLHRSTG